MSSSRHSPSSLSISTFFTTDISYDSPIALEIASIFGLTSTHRSRFSICNNLKIDISPPQILFITGQSGSGKSTIFKILYKHLSDSLDIDKLRISKTKILPEHFNCPLERALHFLSIAGLADAHLFLRTPAQLSDGQLYRFKLALAMSKQSKFIFADQFLDPLDRITAKILAHNVRKFSYIFDRAFILASPNNDFFNQLKPDILIETHFNSDAKIKYFKRALTHKYS